MPIRRLPLPFHTVHRWSSPCLVALLAVLTSPTASAADRFAQEIRPFLATYCYRCHGTDAQKGDVNLEAFTSAQDMVKRHELWRLASHLVRDGEMPSKGDQPTPAEKMRFITAVDALLDLDWEQIKRPGHVMLARLSNEEYDNSVRDLTGADIKPSRRFPKDITGGNGFTNDRSALFVSGSQMENYFAAADEILDYVIARERHKRDEPFALRVDGHALRMGEGAFGRTPWGWILTRPQQTLFTSIDFPRAGFYDITVNAGGAGVEPKAKVLIRNGFPAEPRLTVSLNETFAGDLAITSPMEKFASYTTQVWVEQGPQRICCNITGGSVGVDWVAVREVREADYQSPIFLPRETSARNARALLEHVATRAFRRPVRDHELDYLVSLFTKSSGTDFLERLRLPLKAVLIDPHFLYHVEEQPASGASRTLSGLELASRLSFFMWLSLPDERLMSLGESGALLKPAVLAQEVQRLLRDPKSRAMSSTLCRQWFGIDELGVSAVPDSKSFPQFTENLRRAMVQETELFFDHLLREDIGLMALLDADYTFLNEDLAKHYGIGDVSGSGFRKVTLRDRNRGGVLGMASVLTVSSTPYRTSPVIRGMWVLERLLGREIPPPPADVGAIEERAGTSPKRKSLRDLLAAHRANPNCASCHDKIDPMGFGLENFDAIGRFSDTRAGRPVDNAGTMPDGVEFRGPSELKQALKQHYVQEFSRNLVKKTLSFALGRGLEYYDEYTIRQIEQAFAASGYKPSVLFARIASSLPFTAIDNLETH